MFNFKKERLIKESIGQGSFGEVFPYQKNPQDAKWVVKRIRAKKTVDLLRCLPEIVLGFSCDHPCIVPVKGYSIESKDDKYNVFLKLPRMSGGNLADEIRRRNKKDEYYSEEELLKHFYALISAVDYLHSKKIFHGDIKMNNILLDDKGNLKLCDIGSGKFVPDEDHYHTMTGANGAINYKAPEIIQHERALREYNLKSQNEKRNQPIENILKKEHLYLADSWSLGLTMLEICMLGSRLINPYDPVQLIEENLQKIKIEAGKRYSEPLLEIIFDLLKTGPIHRFEVSAVKVNLEESFKHILTEDLKATLNLSKEGQRTASSNISNSFKIFNTKTNEILRAFEEERRKKEVQLNSFEETFKKLQKKFDALNLEMKRMKAQKKKEIAEACKKYEESLQTLKQENLVLFERLEKEPTQILQTENQVLPRKPRDEKAHRLNLEKISDELNKKWNPWTKRLFGELPFKFEAQPYLSIIAQQLIDDKTLKEITEDMIYECGKDNFWEEIDGLELILGSKLEKSLVGSISDQGLKKFASQLGPRLSNLKHLVVSMNRWKNITDDGLKGFAIQIGPQLTNIEHFSLHMHGWQQITDEGLEVLVSQIAPQLQIMKHLTLDLWHWNKISDKGLAALASQLLPKLVNANHLTFNFGRWVKITDEGLKAFASQIGPQLANLTAFELNLNS